MKKSVEEVLEMLMEENPRYKEQLQEALDAYETPLYHFCEQEAFYRLTDCMLLDEECDQFQDMLNALTRNLYDSNYLIDSTTIEQILSELVVKYDRTVKTVREAESLAGNPLINLKRSDKENLAIVLCERNHYNSVRFYKKFVECMYDKLNKDYYISWNDLQKFCKDCYDECCIEIKERKRSEKIVTEDNVTDRVKEIVKIAKEKKLTADDLSVEAECLEQYGSWQYAYLMYYSAKEISEAADYLNQQEENAKSWIKTDDMQWARKVGNGQYLLMEVRYWGDNYVLCRGFIDLDDYKDDYPSLIKGYYDSWEALVDSYPDEEERNQILAEIAFEKIDTYVLEHNKAFKTEEEAVAATEKKLH